MMKKTIAMFLLVAAVLLSLSACSEDAPLPNTAPQPTTAPQISGDPAVDQTDYRNEVLLQFTSIAEASASDFEYTVGANGVTINAYRGSAAQVRVPERIEGQAVAALADGAFAGQSAMTALYLPDTIASVGSGVLKDCNALVALRTPLIGADANAPQFLGYLYGGATYNDNTKVPATLRYVQLGNVLTALSDSAFADCNHLVAVLLGDRISSVGNFAFYYCEALKYVNMDRLTQVGEYAFASCAALVRVELGAVCTSVGLGAFQGCGSISSMVLPFVGKSATEHGYLGYMFGATAVEFTAGYVPAYLRSITLLEGCNKLDNYAFFECSCLQTVNLPSTLTEIGIRAFEGCTTLSALTLPNSLHTIRENAFVGCTGLEHVVFGEGMTSIGINAFYNCTALKEIRLPMSLTSLPASAFANCVAAETVSLGGVTSVGKNAFRNCNAVTNVQTALSVSFESGNNTVSKFLGIDSNEEK